MKFVTGVPRLKGIVYLPSGSSNVWFLATE
jgi:hypothetical protein